MDITFIAPDGRRETHQNIKRFYRADPEDTDLPPGHQQTWVLEDFEGGRETVGWDYVVSSGSNVEDR